jgi:hypothetical protein
MLKNKNLLPFVYTYVTRVGNHSTLFGILLIEHFPVSFITYVSALGLTLNEQSFLFIIKLTLLYCLLSLIYEIGYMVNDTISIKWDKSPTERFVPDSSTLIVGLINRFLFYAVLLISLLTFRIGLSITRILIISALLTLLYQVHNVISIRYTNVRLYTYVALRTLRYLFVPMTISNDLEKSVFLTLLIMMPNIIYSAMDYACKKVYGKQLTLIEPRYSSIFLRFISFLPLQIVLLNGEPVFLIPTLVIVCLSAIYFYKDYK